MKAHILLATISCCSALTVRPLAKQPVRPHLAVQPRLSPTMAADSPTSAITYGFLGLVANPVMLWSLYTLKTTGCGLPAGPGGLIGALEGVSYLVVGGFVAAALYKKVTSGSGLPAGPGGILGAAEGLSFLTAFAGLVVLGCQIVDYGYIPNAVPYEGGVCS